MPPETETPEVVLTERQCGLLINRMRALLAVAD
jgi:hypothetical protein